MMTPLLLVCGLHVDIAVNYSARPRFSYTSLQLGWENRRTVVRLTQGDRGSSKWINWPTADRLIPLVTSNWGCVGSVTVVRLDWELTVTVGRGWTCCCCCCHLQSAGIKFPISKSDWHASGSEGKLGKRERERTRLTKGMRERKRGEGDWRESPHRAPLHRPSAGHHRQ